MSKDMGQARRRGLLQPGDRVQITDPKGKMHTIILVPGGRFQSARGALNHDDVLGGPDAQVVTTEEGRTFQVIRPLLSDYVLSMPRGAAIVYPKDAAQIVQMGDIFPGARVLEAGVGSGALSLSLLQAVGEGGHLLSVEQRPDFAQIAAANVDLWFGQRHPAWELQVGDVGEVAGGLEPASLDRVVLDLLDPWSYLEQVRRVLRPGGVLICYVATVTQLSRVADDLRATEAFTEPQSWESTVRPWHVEGLAVRPEHRMVAHTGFLLTARLLGQDQHVHQLARRPAKAAVDQPGKWARVTNWRLEDLGMRSQSPKKTRRIQRDLEGRLNQWLGR
ncbi:tRNA (adenine-N1)-methyltransferase [Actinomyces sp. F1_1611]